MGGGWWVHTAYLETTSAEILGWILLYLEGGISSRLSCSEKKKTILVGDEVHTLFPNIYHHEGLQPIEYKQNYIEQDFQNCLN